LITADRTDAIRPRSRQECARQKVIDGKQIALFADFENDSGAIMKAIIADLAHLNSLPTSPTTHDPRRP